MAQSLLTVLRGYSFVRIFCSVPRQISANIFPVPIRASFRISSLLFSLTIFLFSILPSVRAQSAATQAPSLLPGPEPPDVSVEWRQLVGIYGQSKASIVVLERDSKLFLQGTFFSANGSTEVPIQGPQYPGLLSVKTESSSFNIFIESHSNQAVERLVLLPAEPSGTSPRPDSKRKYEIHEPRYFVRQDAGADRAGFYHVHPVKPINQLRMEAIGALPPAEEGPFRKPDLVELSTLDPAFRLDIRYAQSKNFLNTPVYTQARAFMQRPAADALLRVLHKLQPLGYGLLIHDAYRPWYVTKIFWDATPPEGHKFVADPARGSKHNRGCAVDITLYDPSNGRPIEMPGLYDEMSPRSYPTFPGGTSLQRWHRDLLRRAMESEGFTVNEAEWWHFDYKDWKNYPILNLSFEKLGQE